MHIFFASDSIFLRHQVQVPSCAMYAPVVQLVHQQVNYVDFFLLQATGPSKMPTLSSRCTSPTVQVVSVGMPIMLHLCCICTCCMCPPPPLCFCTARTGLYMGCTLPYHVHTRILEVAFLNYFVKCLVFGWFCAHAQYVWRVAVQTPVTVFCSCKVVLKGQDIQILWGTPGGQTREPKSFQEKRGYFLSSHPCQCAPNGSKHHTKKASPLKWFTFTGRRIYTITSLRCGFSRFK